MRPTNPSTGLPFKRGDVAPDGRIFWEAKRYVRWARNRDHFDSLTNARRYANRYQFGCERTQKSVARSLLQGARERARASGGVVSIDLCWVLERLRGSCALTGLSFVIPCSGKPEARAPSLDRINSEDHNYSPENTRLVLWQVNAALNRFSDIESLPIIEALSAGLRKAVQNAHSQSI